MQGSTPCIDERVGGGLCGLVRDDGGHAVRLSVVIGRRMHVARALGGAGVQAGERAADEAKPGGSITRG